MHLNTNQVFSFEVLVLLLKSPTWDVNCACLCWHHKALLNGLLDT